MNQVSEHELLTTGEVARLFKVDPKTVTRWSNLGLLRAMQPFPGAHRRYRRADVQALLDRRPGDDLPE